MKQRLKKLMEQENKLRGISKEITRMIKQQKSSCGEKYKGVINQWCKSFPVANTIKATWKFIEAIQDMINN